MINYLFQKNRRLTYLITNRLEYAWKRWKRKSKFSFLKTFYGKKTKLKILF